MIVMTLQFHRSRPEVEQFIKMADPKNDGLIDYKGMVHYFLWR